MVSYSVFFQLGEPFLKKADSILNKHYEFDNPSAYSSVKYELIKDIIDWNDVIFDWITVTFTKDYKISKTGVTCTALLSFSNFKSIHDSNNNSEGIKKMLLYNPLERKFLISN